MSQVLKSVRKLSVLSSAVAGLTLMVSAQAAQAAEVVSTKDYLKSSLSGFAGMAKESFALSADDKKALTALAPDAADESFTFYYGKGADGKAARACTIVGQKGKEGPLSIGVCFEPTGLIQAVTVLAHQEERGKGIVEQSFLKQFSGKKVSDAFQVGKDVDGISGATWSSKGVSEAVRKSSFAFDRFVKGKK